MREVLKQFAGLTREDESLLVADLLKPAVLENPNRSEAGLCDFVADDRNEHDIQQVVANALDCAGNLCDETEAGHKEIAGGDEENRQADNGLLIICRLRSEPSIGRRPEDEEREK